MQISIKGYITSKRTELFYDCADRYAYNKSQNKFAISDGVTKSFFPKIWADVLVNKWVSKKWNSDKEFTDACQKEWLRQVIEVVKRPDVKWFTKNAYNRKEPGLATFVGLRFIKEKKDWYWRAYALGDSFLFFVPNKFKDFSKECIVLSSKQEPIVFDNFPDYLSSLGNNHKGEKQFKEKPLTSGTFYLMTDALAEWFLNEKDNAVSKVAVWQNQKDFERFVDEERHNDKLGDDDSAILIITIKEDNKEELTYVSEEVNDINELIKKQQEEIEDKEKAKEQEVTIQENTKSEISKDDTKEEEPSEFEPTEEVEIEKPQKGIKKRKEIFDVKKGRDQTDETEFAEKIETTEEQKKEKETSTPFEEVNAKVEKSKGSESFFEEIFKKW